MQELSVNDFYDVKKMSLISNVDIETFIDFYLPLVGNNGLAIYLSLYNDISFYNGAKIQSHDILLSKLGLSTVAFVNAMKRLEALSLVSTYYQKGNTNSYFTYCLYAPLDPKAFFSSDILLSTLEATIGQAAVNGLKEKYSSNVSLDGFKNVSTEFGEIYSFRKYLKPHINTNQIKGREARNVKETFDLQVFSKEIAEFGIDIANMGKEEIDRIKAYSNFYAIDPKKMANYVSKYFVPTKEMGKRINFSSLERECRLAYENINHDDESIHYQVTNDTPMGKKINLMDECDPIKYLTLLQNGGRPSNGDLKILEHLRIDLNLKDPVINALIDYVLGKNNNVLSYAYADKVAGSLARMNFSYAKEAMDYLTEIEAKMKSNKKKEVTSSIKSVSTPVINEEEEEISDEDVAKALEGL